MKDAYEQLAEAKKKEAEAATRVAREVELGKLRARSELLGLYSSRAIIGVQAVSTCACLRLSLLLNFARDFVTPHAAHVSLPTTTP